jgi:hypothetical protein
MTNGYNEQYLSQNQNENKSQFLRFRDNRQGVMVDDFRECLAIA